VTAPSARLRLATEDGRCVARIGPAKRQAAQTQTDAARLARSIAAMHREALEVLQIAEAAHEVAKTAFGATTRATAITDRALARENLIEAGYVAARVRGLIRMAEMALEGSLGG
jgi:hypothetical protein